MKDTFIFRKENRLSIDRMDDADAGALLKAIMAHADGEAVDLDDCPAAVQLLFPLIAAQIDRADAAYEETCQKRAEAGRQGGRPKKANAFDEKQKKQMLFEESKKSKSKHSEPEPEPDNEPDIKENPLKGVKEKRERLSPPTVEEVRAYCEEKGLKVDAERFVSFYESKGWMVGKNKMVSWHSALSGWASRDKRELPPNKDGPDSLSVLEGLDYTKLLHKGAR